LVDNCKFIIYLSFDAIKKKGTISRIKLSKFIKVVKNIRIFFDIKRRHSQHLFYLARLFD